MERVFAIDIVNKAAQDLYESADMTDCLWEELFSFVVTDSPLVKQVTFPFYVGPLRAIREFRGGNTPVRLHDMRPRYHYGGWGEGLTTLTYRIRAFSYPLERDMETEGPVVISFPAGASAGQDITITIIGENDSAAHVYEEITIAASDVSKVTTKSFMFNGQGIKKIRKNIYTLQDVIISDINGIQIARIPNNQLETSYTLVQLDDWAMDVDCGSNYIEALYKKKFFKMKNDFDDFPVPGLDSAIYFKSVARYYAKKQGKEDLAILNDAKATEQVKNFITNQEQGVDKEMNFAPSPYLSVYPPSRYCGPSSSRRGRA